MLIEHVVLENYKSIAHCDVELPQVCFVVGPNGAGKSNFVDALSFLSDIITLGLGKAIEQRKGFQSLVHQGDLGRTIKLGVTFQTHHYHCDYKIHFHHHPTQNHTIQYEYFKYSPTLRAREDLSNSWSGCTYERDHKNIILQEHDSLYPDKAHTQIFPIQKFANEDIIESHKKLSPFYAYSIQKLSLIHSYSFRPEPIYEPEQEQPQELHWNGQGIKNVLLTMKKNSPLSYNTLQHYIKLLIPSLTQFEIQAAGGYLFLHFETLASETQAPLVFQAFQMSDGTLLALGTLTALFQHFEGDDDEHLILLEEPESALHPAAGGLLRDALTEAGQRNQVVVTTHNSSMLDHKEVDPDSVLVAQTIEGKTYLGPIDPVDQGFIRDRKFTVGNLMEFNQLYSQEARDQLRATKAGE